MTYYKEEFMNYHLKAGIRQNFIPNELTLPPAGDFPKLQMFALGCSGLFLRKCVSCSVCLTLCDPMDCRPLGFSVHGISRKEYQSGLPFPSPGDLSDPEIEPGSPTFQADSLLSEPAGKLVFKDVCPKSHQYKASLW